MKPTVSPILRQASTDSISKRGFIGKYKIVSLLKDEGGAKVYSALYIRTFWYRRCVIKTSRPGPDMEVGRTRLAWEFKVLCELSSRLPVSKPIEEFTLEGHYYIVLEFITGQTLQSAINGTYDDVPYKALSNTRKKRLIEWALESVQLIANLHELGFVHRDISASNILVSKTRLYLVDLEQSWNFSESDGIIFPAWTKGYSSPQQLRNALPTVKDDVYSLGCLLINLLTNIHPMTLNLRNLRSTAGILSRQIEYADLLDLVLRCIDPVSSRRPGIQEIVYSLSNYNELMKSNSNGLATGD